MLPTVGPSQPTGSVVLSWHFWTTCLAHVGRTACSKFGVLEANVLPPSWKLQPPHHAGAGGAVPPTMPPAEESAYRRVPDRR